MKCTGKEWDTCRVEKMGCKGCYYDEKEFVTFTKDEEAINVYFVKDGIKVADILMGVAAIIKIIMEETGKDKETVLKIVNEIIDEANKKKKGKIMKNDKVENIKQAIFRMICRNDVCIMNPRLCY